MVCPAAECAASETAIAIRSFMQHARRPAILEPGEELYEITCDNYCLSGGKDGSSIQVWDSSRHMARRITGPIRATKGGIAVPVKRLMRSDGELLLLDLALPGGMIWRVRSHQLAFAERLRQILSREFPGCDIREITTEESAEQGISGEYPRARVRFGDRAVAAVAGPEHDCTLSAILGIGLCWLAHVRKAEGNCGRADLAIFVPAGTCDLVLSGLDFVDPAKAQCYVYVFDGRGYASRVEYPPWVGSITRT